jgi:hypothetical protein
MTPDTPIKLRDLIYPDRYDILSEAKFALYCKQHRDVWEADPVAFIRMVRRDTTWMQEHEMLDYMWKLWAFGRQPRPDAREEAFLADTSKLFQIIGQLEESGEIPGGEPIQVIYGLHLLPGIDGAAPHEYARQMFLANARHRLSAWLAIVGKTELDVHQFEKLIYEHYRPFVTTPAFLETGLLSSLRDFERDLDEFLKGGE